MLITRLAEGHRTRTVTDAPGSMVDSLPRAARGRLKGRPREVLNGQTPTEILDTIINGATTP